jgi:hypothetical protein
MLAHIHCSLSLSLLFSALLILIASPLFTAQRIISNLEALRNRFAGQLELEQDDWILTFRVNSKKLLVNSEGTGLGGSDHEVERIGEWAWSSTGYARYYFKGLWAVLIKTLTLHITKRVWVCV